MNGLVPCQWVVLSKGWRGQHKDLCPVQGHITMPQKKGPNMKKPCPMLHLHTYQCERVERDWRAARIAHVTCPVSWVGRVQAAVCAGTQVCVPARKGGQPEGVAHYISRRPTCGDWTGLGH